MGIETATILAELRMDTDTVIAGLLHDTVEDTDVSADDIRRRFGNGVANLVEGVTDGPKGVPDETNQCALLLAMSMDWRIVLVKLADPQGARDYVHLRAARAGGGGLAARGGAGDAVRADALPAALLAPRDAQPHGLHSPRPTSAPPHRDAAPNAGCHAECPGSAERRGAAVLSRPARQLALPRRDPRRLRRGPAHQQPPPAVGGAPRQALRTQQQ